MKNFIPLFLIIVFYFNLWNNENDTQLTFQKWKTQWQFRGYEDQQRDEHTEWLHGADTKNTRFKITSLIRATFYLSQYWKQQNDRVGCLHHTGNFVFLFIYSRFSQPHKIDNIAMADLGGHEGPVPPPRPNSFNFMQFWGKFGKIICWRPPTGELAPPPQGNPGSAIEKGFFWEKSSALNART